MDGEGIDKSLRSQESVVSRIEADISRRARTFAERDVITTTTADRYDAIYDAQHEAAQAAGLTIKQIALDAVKKAFEKNPNATRDGVIEEIERDTEAVLATHFAARPVPPTPEEPIGTD